jgi:hypothetical protein
MAERRSNDHATGQKTIYYLTGICGRFFMAAFRLFPDMFPIRVTVFANPILNLGGEPSCSWLEAAGDRRLRRKAFAAVHMSAFVQVFTRRQR